MPSILSAVRRSVAILTVAFVFLASAVKSEEPKDAPDQKASANAVAQRAIHFPADRAIGTVYWRNFQPDSSVFDFYDRWSKGDEARGDVNVPANAEVRLDIGKVASTDLSFLNNLGEDDIQFVNLRGTDVTDEQLKYVGHLTGLLALDIEEARISDASVAAFSALRKLRWIDLSAFDVNEHGFGMGDGALKVLADLPKLERIDLRLTKVTDAGMAELARLKSLKCLGVAGTKVTDAGLTPLKDLPQLEYLDLGVYNEGAKITDAGLKIVDQMAHLKSLNLSGTKVTDDGLAELKDLSHLDSISLDNTQVTEAGFVHLEPLSALTDLRFYPRRLPAVTDAGAEELAKLKSLKRIMTILLVTGKGLAALATLPHLEQLELYGQQITDDDMRPFAGMKSLQRLTIQKCPITDDALSQLTGLENLECLYLFRTRVTGEGLKYLEKLPRLSLVTIQFEDDNKQHLGVRPNLKYLSKLPHLKTLNLAGASLTNDDVKELATLTHLEELQLDFKVNDEGAKTIGELTTLKTLILNSTSITDKGLESLSKLKNLEVLALNGQFSDAGIARLNRLQSLHQLYIGSPQLTQAGLTALTDQLPAVQEVNAVQHPEVLTRISPKDSIGRYGTPADRGHKDEMEDKPPPALKVTGWINTPAKGIAFDDLRGKVVVVDFWGTWCGPCRKMMPHLKELYEKNQDKGLVIVSIHTMDGAEKMPEFVSQEKLTWPMAADVDEATVDGWNVCYYPTLYLIDRMGKLRMAGIEHDDLDKAVSKLLDEPAPASAPHKIDP